MSKKPVFKNGDTVVACPKAMADGAKAGQLMSRTRLTAEELSTPMHVVKNTHDGQIEVKHERILQPFTVHPKFMVSATSTA
jgi:hypothetical protein